MGCVGITGVRKALPNEGKADSVIFRISREIRLILYSWLTAFHLRQINNFKLKSTYHLNRGLDEDANHFSNCYVLLFC